MFANTTEVNVMSRNPLRRASLAVALLSLVSRLSSAQQASAPTWQASAPTDFDVALDTVVRHGGSTSVHFRATGAEPEGFAVIAQRVRADEFRGHRVRLAAWLRAVAVGGGGGTLWIRVDGPGRVLGFANLGDRVVQGTRDWTRVDVVVDVPDSAIGVSFGALLAGPGDLWADDIAFEVAGPIANAPPFPSQPAGKADETRRAYADRPTMPAALDFERTTLALGRPPAGTPRAPAREPPRPFAGRGLENVAALARLYGYVRYFYPSSEARAADWDSLLVDGMRRVEGAPDADSLARTLAAIIAPVAPTVQLFAAAAPIGPRVVMVPKDATCVLHWVHHGVGTGNNFYRPGASPYRSGRLCTPATDGHLPAGVPDPRVPKEVALGAGVVARVPLGLWATARDSAPLIEAPATDPTRFSAADRATRLAAVAETWNVMQHFYPYFDVVHNDWPAELPRALATAATDSGSEAFLVTLRRLVAALHDGHGSVNRLDMAAATANYFSPPLLVDWIEGRLVVTTVADSAEHRVHRGDVVVAIEGRPAEAAIRQLETIISGATPQWIRRGAVRTVLAGRSGTTVTLRLSPASGGAEHDVTLTRTSKPGTLAEARPATVAELRPGVFYLDLDRLTDAQFDSILPTLERARGIVFDMRGYPSHVDTPRILAHLSDSALHSAHFDVPVYARPDREGVTYIKGGWPVPPLAPRLRAKVAFVTGGGAISYAETTMGIVEAYHLGAIVGEPTAGTNGNINPILIPGGYNVVWTGMRVLKHDGSRHHGVGILPTVPVHRTLKGVAAGRDEVLERALAVVGG